MDLGDQGTSCVDHSQPALFAGTADFRRYAVSAVNYAFTIRNLVNRIDKNGTFALQFLNHKTIVDDLLADIDRRPKGFERDADNIDGTHHSGAEPTRFQQKQTFLAL